MAINTDGSDTLKMVRAAWPYSAAFIAVAPQPARCPGRLVRMATCVGCPTHSGGAPPRPTPQCQHAVVVGT